MSEIHRKSTAKTFA